ncbi:hypothetical protein C7S16_2697 [Burkholderia thailandensis]|uniref:Uncharacterized protein n=1 Tax=Burkholderia thailandensis TaxID=57975 RepID=A0AAW9CYC7_BURTH|nr:hypothetical protein [Burkholderia thailandensis]MDW9253847.1 hypothetical protein [Burkholderia thailandensis]
MAAGRGARRPRRAPQAAGLGAPRACVRSSVPGAALRCRAPNHGIVRQAA